jgi:hypothetical protein
LQCGWDEAKADALAGKPSSGNATKSKSKGPTKSKSAGGGGATTSNKAGPSNTNAISVSLQDLKRQASSPGGQPVPKKSRGGVPLAPSQDTNKQKQQQQQQQQSQSVGGALKKLKTKAVDDNSSNEDAPDGANNAIAGAGTTKPTATGPRNIIYPSSPRAGGAAGGSGARGRGRGNRILSTLLHVSSLTFDKIRGKIVYQYDEVTVDDVKYRVYNKDLVIASKVCFREVPADGKPADMTVDTWKVREKYQHSDEYFVDCIAAERLTKEKPKAVKKGSSSAKKGAAASGAAGTASHYEYLLKYTRFELDPGPESWLSYEEVEETAAFDKWEKTGRSAWVQGTSAVKTAAGLES